MVLVCPSPEIVAKVQKQITLQTQKLERQDIINAALQNSFAVCLKTKKDQVDFINAYAPEHYIINVENESYFVENCANAGSVLSEITLLRAQGITLLEQTTPCLQMAMQDSTAGLI